MVFMCCTCNLKDDIEKHRIILNNLIVNKGKRLHNQEIINSSQKLDRLVSKCLSCNRSQINSSELIS